MTEQSIRDEIARELYEADGRYSWTWDELVAGWARGQENGLDPNYPHLVRAFRNKADLILASPVIRRIQAEALRTWADFQDQAIRDIAYAADDDDRAEVNRWTVGARAYADRIEKEQQS